jgi:hypothetical protein
LILPRSLVFTTIDRPLKRSSKANRSVILMPASAASWRKVWRSCARVVDEPPSTLGVPFSSTNQDAVESLRASFEAAGVGSRGWTSTAWAPAAQGETITEDIVSTSAGRNRFIESPS